MNQQELRELENRCIQEHAPACTAACPIHVDVRGMIAAIPQGDFAAGLKIMRKTMPFPGIISHICGQPCRAVCKIGEAGGAHLAIAIADLEKACVIWGGEGEPVRLLPPKPKRVAVVGGGLSGLTVAYDLARKGYRITIYEAAGRLGGSLWKISPEQLPVPVIEHDLSVFEKLGIEIFLDVSVGKVGSNGRRPPLALLCEQYEAVYLGTGADASEIYDLTVDAQGKIQIDPITYMTSQDGVFAGGSLLHARDILGLSLSRLGQPEPTQNLRVDREEERQSAEDAPPPVWRSAIFSVMDGRRAATSIDRYLQKVSLTAARFNEGPYTTRLFTQVADIQAQPVVAAADPVQGYTRDEATQEAQRCIQCECMECVKVCEYLKHYGGYPKKYVREIYNNLSIVMGTRYSNKLVNSCSLCGLCSEVCPENLDMGIVCKEARQVMVEQKRMPPSAHDFALRDMAFSNGQKFALARNQPGTQISAYVFFPGCQLSASSPQYVEKLYGYLCEALPAEQAQGVGLILRCCGAPADWAGRTDLFQAAMAEFMLDYEQMGRPKLVLACSSCYQVFKTHFPEVAILSLWEVIDQHGLPERALGKPRAQSAALPLAIHDPCSTRYEKGIQDSARNIVQRLGYELIELPLSREKTECCSYGGLMWLAHPELAAQVVQRRIAESPHDYITYCAMCRDFFARQGKPTLHLLDILFGAPADISALVHRESLGYSQRHENRARLKSNMLKKYWREDMDDEQAADSIRSEKIQLIITPEVQQVLDERLILVEDIQQVIEYAQRSGKKLLNKKTGRFLAYYKPVAVTYWVEYLPQGDAFEIYRAYSHRMEIGEEVVR